MSNSVFSYPTINIWMFINDWNAKIPSNILAKVYKLKTVARVNSYANKLRKEGHNLLPRSRGPNKEVARK